MANNTIRPDYYANMPIEPHLIAEQESYNVGTAIVYLMRAGKKGSAIEDYKKAITHLEFEKEIIGYHNNYYKLDIDLSLYYTNNIFKAIDILRNLTAFKEIEIDKAIKFIQDEIKQLEEANK